MAGKSAGSVVKAIGEYHYPWWEKSAKYKDELSTGVGGFWHLGAWKPFGISARCTARLWKEVLLAGMIGRMTQRGNMKTKRKEYKVDRIAAEERENTAKLMERIQVQSEKKMKEEEKAKENK